MLVFRGLNRKQVVILTMKKWVILGAPFFNSRVDFNILVAMIIVVKAIVSSNKN